MIQYNNILQYNTMQYNNNNNNMEIIILLHWAVTSTTQTAVHPLTESDPKDPRQYLLVFLDLRKCG